jgi:hypothetical protein
MPLYRSEKARLELRSKPRVLGLRERGALFLADGLKDQTKLQGLLQDDGSILQKLISEGYLIHIREDDAGAASFGALMPAQAPQAFEMAIKSSNASDFSAFSAASASVASSESLGGTFQGNRSLASTRMFLFDICERMFSRHAPHLAVHYRNHLREARDRESMLLMALDILEEIEQLAGAERAEGIRERIVLLLPTE